MQGNIHSNTNKNKDHDKLVCINHNQPILYICKLRDCKIKDYICKDCKIVNDFHKIVHHDFIMDYETALNNYSIDLDFIKTHLHKNDQIINSINDILNESLEDLTTNYKDFIRRICLKMNSNAKEYRIYINERVDHFNENFINDMKDDKTLKEMKNKIQKSSIYLDKVIPLIEREITSIIDKILNLMNISEKNINEILRRQINKDDLSKLMEQIHNEESSDQMNNSNKSTSNHEKDTSKGKAFKPKNKIIREIQNNKQEVVYQNTNSLISISNQTNLENPLSSNQTLMITNEKNVIVPNDSITYIDLNESSQGKIGSENDEVKKIIPNIQDEHSASTIAQPDQSNEYEDPIPKKKVKVIADQVPIHIIDDDDDKEKEIEIINKSSCKSYIQSIMPFSTPETQFLLIVKSSSKNPEVFNTSSPIKSYQYINNVHTNYFIANIQEQYHDVIKILKLKNKSTITLMTPGINTFNIFYIKQNPFASLSSTKLSQTKLLNPIFETGIFIITGGQVYNNNNLTLYDTNFIPNPYSYKNLKGDVLNIVPLEEINCFLVNYSNFKLAIWKLTNQSKPLYIVECPKVKIKFIKANLKNNLILVCGHNESNALDYSYIQLYEININDKDNLSLIPKYDKPLSIKGFINFIDILVFDQIITLLYTIKNNSALHYLNKLGVLIYKEYISGKCIGLINLSTSSILICKSFDKKSIINYLIYGYMFQYKQILNIDSLLELSPSSSSLLSTSTLQYHNIKISCNQINNGFSLKFYLIDYVMNQKQIKFHSVDFFDTLL